MYRSNSLRLVFDFDCLAGFLYFSISNISRMLLQLFEIPREFTYVIYIVFLLAFFIKHIPRIKLVDILYYIIIVPIVSIGLINYHKYIGSTSNIFAILILFLPSYLFIRLLDIEKLIKTFIISQHFAIVYLLFYYFTTIRNATHYSMDYGYWIAVPIVVMAYLYINNHNPVYIILVIIATITLIVQGNRGALLLSIICVMYYYVMGQEGSGRKRIIARVGVLLCIILVLYVTSDIWKYYLSAYFSHSRTVQKILEGSLLTSSTRERLYKTIKHLISSNITGYGPLASRKLLYPIAYPHSLLYELQLDFGAIVGAIIAVTIVLMGCVNLIAYRNREIKVFVGYVEILGLGHLIVSSSYYYEDFVPITFAMFYLLIRDKKATP